MGVFRLALAAGVVIAAGYGAYQVGLDQNRAEVQRLEQDLADREQDAIELWQRMAAAEQAAADAEARARAIAERYRSDVPTGLRARLLGLIDQRMEAGVSADRLRFVIAEAQNERVCRETTDTRRLLVRTPINADTRSLGFAGNRITLTSEGRSARDEAGDLGPLFDPRRPVTLRFTLINGRRDTAEGSLPLTHRLVVEGRSYHFAARADEEPGFIEVTMQDCAYP